MDTDSNDAAIKHVLGVTLNLTRIRLVIAWPAIAVLGAGVTVLWISALLSLFTTGGFAGIAGWQTLGVVILSYQGAKTYERVTELKDTQAPELRAMRGRLWTIFGIVAASIVANVVAIFLIVRNLLDGRLAWTLPDTLSYIAVGVTLIVFLIIQRSQIFKNQASLFFVVASTRMVPQGLLAFSADLRSISWWVLLGMLSITGQRALVSLIEFFEAKTKAVSAGSVNNARWILRSDAGNLLAITVPIIFKIFA